MQKHAELSDDFKRNSHQNEIKKSIKLDPSFLNGIHNQTRLYEAASKTLSNMTEMTPKLLDANAFAEQVTATIDPEMTQIGKVMHDSYKSIGPDMQLLTKAIQPSVLMPNFDLSEIVKIMQSSITSSLFTPIPKRDNIQEQIHEKFIKQFQERTEFVKKANPRLSKLADVICLNGWGLSPSIGTEELFEIVDNDLEVNTTMANLYEKNNYKYLINDLNYIKESLPDALKDIPELIKKTFLNDSTTYKLMMSNLFSLLDYLFIRGTGLEFISNDDKRKGITSKGNLKHEVKKLKKTLKGHPSGDIQCLYTLRVVQIIQRLFAYIPNMSQPFEEVNYGRNSIDHGRYDIRKLKKIDFYQLVSVCASYEMLSNQGN